MEVLIRAREIECEIERLYAEQDAILKPLVKEAMSKGVEAAMDLIVKIPSGYYRTELRAWINRQTQ